MNRKKILVVDDNLVILKTLSMKLKSSGFDVVVAKDGAEAANAARLEKPELILLDISFPTDSANFGGVAWDGFLIIEWLRRIETAKNTPIIIITGGESEKYKDRSLAAGATAFFHKPINNDELIDVIHKTLSETPSEASAKS